MRHNRLLWAGLAALALSIPSGSPTKAVARPDTSGRPAARPSYAGELLVASSSLRDPNFHKTVILLVRHNDSGAFGLVLNRMMGTVKISKILKQLGLNTPENEATIKVHYGGPVQPESGFVLFSTEFKSPHSQRISEQVAFSTDAAILREVAFGKGPRRLVFAVGYSGWGPGQLEAEMRQGAWHTAPADEDVLFDENYDTKWERAMKRRFRTL